MKNKFLALLVIMCICILSFGAVNVSAATYGDLTYEIANGEVTITDCDESATNVVILPKTINGYPVTTIDDYAFYNCSSLTSVTIPDGVTSIGGSAFSGCANLTRVTIPDGVTTIGNCAFYNCTSLKNMSLGNSITSIGDSAFYNCISLTSITIPDSVTSIGDKAFYYCYSLTNVSLSNRVTTIGYQTFYNCTSLTSVSLGNSITSISNMAFSHCRSLSNITIPDSVTTIGDYAFDDCTSLTSVTIGNSVTAIGEYAFRNCDSLTRVDISNIEVWCKISFTDYTSNPLSYAKNLYLNGKLVTNLTIPDSVTTIDDYAFYNCTSLTSVSLGNSITSISNMAFSYCRSLSDIIVDEDNPNYCSVNGNLFNKDKTVLIQYAFGKLNTHYTIPDSVTTIGDYAFSECDNLTSVTIPDSVTSIGDYTFSACDNLTNVIIGNGVTTIGCRAFYLCKSLTSVCIPESVTSIGDYAFSVCDNLTSMTIGNGLTIVGNFAFMNCTSLTSVNLGNSTTTIGNLAFYGCSSLTSITIPDSVTTIGTNVFGGCGSLKTIIIGNGIQRLEDRAFSQLSSLTNVTIGSGITTIPVRAFSGCENLKCVGLSKELLYIKNNAFNNCPNIELVFYEGTEIQWDDVLKYSGNTNLTDADIIFSATKKTYKFVTNSDEVLPDITDYAVLSSPTVRNTEKNFLGWYDNKELSGETVTFPYYSDATTLYAAWADRTGESFDDARIAEANKEYSVTTNESGQLVYYEFVPRLTGEYRFYSTGSIDTYGYLYNSSRSQITSDDDDGSGNNFYISYNLTAGQTYYIAMKCYSGSGTFTFVTETDCVESTATVCVTSSDGEKIFITVPHYLPEDCQIILACYRDKQLVELKYAPNKNETIYFIVEEQFDEAKVMAWDDLSSVLPLCDAEVVSEI